MLVERTIRDSILANNYVMFKHGLAYINKQSNLSPITYINICNQNSQILFANGAIRITITDSVQRV